MRVRGEQYGEKGRERVTCKMAGESNDVGTVYRNSRRRLCMGNVDLGCRLRASAIFRSPASLLMEFMRSLLRNGSAKDVSLTGSAEGTCRVTLTRDVVVHTSLQTPFTVTNHCSQ